MQDKKLIISNQTLTEYFYTSLSEVNKQSSCPLPQEFILYSSEVLDRYALSEMFFEHERGKLNEKVLGLNFLEAQQKSISERKQMYLDVGDTILIQLGVFKDRIKKKQNSEGYYISLGKSAYSQAASLDCTFYDIPNFFNLLSTSLENLIVILSAMSESLNYDSLEQYLLDTDKTEYFSFKAPKKKVS